MMLAASVEKGSEHPLGRAVVKKAEASGLDAGAAEAFKAHGGDGVEAQVNGRLSRWASRTGLTTGPGLVSAAMAERISAFQAQGKTVMVAV
jgi:Cu+-exporting ATPase